MAVFYSFHYKSDAWRVQQVINIGSVEGQPLMNSQAWEEIKRRGTSAIQSWIDEQMKYKSAVVVLVGAQTAGRPWVQYEITKAWNERRPLLGIRIHGLADSNGRTSVAGTNPFEKLRVAGGGTASGYVPLFSPGGVGSNAVYASIKQNLATWVASGYRRP